MTESNQLTEMAVMIDKHLEWLRVRGYSEETIYGRNLTLTYFKAWCEERGITNCHEVTTPIVERYQSYLHYFVSSKTKEKIIPRTQQIRLTAVRVFYKWLVRQKYVLYNPAVDIELPRAGFKLPKSILNASEADLVMNQVDLSQPMGLRDRAILEVLYSTGIRRFELCQIQIKHIDFNRGLLLIRQGKYLKDRMIPIGDRALQWVNKYLFELRPFIAPEPDGEMLFLTNDGNVLRPKHLSRLSRQYIAASGLNKDGSCHIFRHTMATLMLEGGADTRYVQEMLGHANLQTTQIYTRVAIGKLKEVHNKTHPGAHLKPKNSKEKPEPEETPDKWLLPEQPAEKKP